MTAQPVEMLGIFLKALKNHKIVRFVKQLKNILFTKWTRLLVENKNLMKPMKIFLKLSQYCICYPQTFDLIQFHDDVVKST